MAVQGRKVVVVGAGVGGLVAAVGLAARGVRVTVLERAANPGGKMREVAVGGSRQDAGPTVLTMRPVLEQVFADAGSSLSEHVTLRPAEILARHAWGPEQRLDLFADIGRSADAIAAFAGTREAAGYRRFCADAGGVFRSLDLSFMRHPQPSLPGLVARAGMGGLMGMMPANPFSTLWGTLDRYFKDPRLRQLFGRYATYCGSSPFAATATLMLVAHVEQSGVWLVEGGMHRLAQALGALATRLGAEIRHGAEVAEILVERGRAMGVRLADGERIMADAVVCNADVGALADGLLGPGAMPAARPVPQDRRSLSALTWSVVAETGGFPLLRHTVFFSHDYRAEFDDIFKRRRLPAEPTVYVCAHDRGAADDDRFPGGPERLLVLVNAPPTGDAHLFPEAEIEQCADRTFALMERCGLTLRRTAGSAVPTSPAGFNRLFPGTGGALYGRAAHGWRASFLRPGSRSRIPGLYLAGGSAHPGPGVPMAALSGRMAAASLLSDWSVAGTPVQGWTGPSLASGAPSP